MKRELRRVWAALALGVAGSLQIGCAGGGRAEPVAGDSPASPAAVIEGPSATLVVLGMSCPLCASNVDKQLAGVPGVQAVKVDKGTGEVSVAFAPGARVTRQQLATAVHDSGFTLAELRVP